MALMYIPTERRGPSQIPRIPHPFEGVGQALMQMGMAKYRAGLQEELWKKTTGAVEPEPNVAEKVYEKYGMFSGGGKMWKADEKGIPQMMGKPDLTYSTSPAITKEGHGIYMAFRDGKPVPEEAVTARDIGKPVRPHKLTLTEKELVRQKGAVGKLQTMASQDPNKVYEHGYKMYEDRSLYLDPVTNAPVKLPPFHKVMGKRGQIKAIKQLGENWDDSKQLMALLKDPEVARNLRRAEKEVGFWDRVSGKWNNKVRLWMQKSGIGANTPTATAITRMQRLASQERKEFLGVAVTGTELQSTLAWMPNAGDSLSTMLTKTQLMVDEGEETFRRWLDIYKDVANMTPLYKAFGLQRFPTEGGAQKFQPLPQETWRKPGKAVTSDDEANAYLKSIGQ